VVLLVEESFLRLPYNTRTGHKRGRFGVGHCFTLKDSMKIAESQFISSWLHFFLFAPSQRVLCKPLTAVEMPRVWQPNTQHLTGTRHGTIMLRAFGCSRFVEVRRKSAYPRSTLKCVLPVHQRKQILKLRKHFRTLLSEKIPTRIERATRFSENGWLSRRNHIRGSLDPPQEENHCIIKCFLFWVNPPTPKRRVPVGS